MRDRRNSKRNAKYSRRNLEAMARRNEGLRYDFKFDPRPTATQLSLRGHSRTSTGGQPGSGKGGHGVPSTDGAVLLGGGSPSFEATGELLPPSGGRYMNISASYRAPRSFRPSGSEWLRPREILRRQFAAVGDRFRVGRLEDDIERVVQANIDGPQLRRLGLRNPQEWQLGPRHGWRPRDVLRGRTSRRGTQPNPHTPNGRPPIVEGFARRPVVAPSLRRLVPQRWHWNNRGDSKWRRGNP